MIRPVVHGAAVDSRVILIGQAPGPREGTFGRPFAWTAGKTMFRWFAESLGVDEETFRARVYIAAVARCFPGKASGGGDRRPDTDEIGRCRTYLEREVGILGPDLVLPVGTLAIEQVLGAAGKRPLRDSGRDDGAGRLPRARGRHHPAAAPERGVDVAPDGAGQDPALPGAQAGGKAPCDGACAGGVRVSVAGRQGGNASYQVAPPMLSQPTWVA